jgi:hypothetical protein
MRHESSLNEKEQPMVFAKVEEARTSCDLEKLYAAMISCVKDAKEEVSRGFYGGAHLQLTCASHHAKRYLAVLESQTPMTPFRTTDVTIAETILNQLGGKRFLVMTGAKLLLAHPSGLSFHLPSNFAEKGINRVRIELTAQDLYDVTFSRCRGLKSFYEHKVEGLYCDQLRSVFTETTGLELSL